MLKKIKNLGAPSFPAPPAHPQPPRVKQCNLFLLKLKRFAIYKISPFIASLGILALVIYQTEPPKNLLSAPSTSLLLFFIPLTLFIYFILNLSPLSLKNRLFITLGLLILVILKGLDLLNILAFLALVGTLTILYKFIHLPQKSSYHPKIPKLSHLHKQH